MKNLFAEECSKTIMPSKGLRQAFLVACLCLLSVGAHALTINCPAYPTNIKTTIGTGTPPAEPIVLQVLVTAGVGTRAIVCKYTVQVTKNFPPINPISSCPAHPLVLSLVATDPAPATGFTPWSFGLPGTPAGSSSTVSAPQSIAPIFSIAGSTRNCQVPDSGVFVFQIYSNFPTGETCTASGHSLSCTAPPPPVASCPQSLKGSQIPTANWSASSTSPAYYAYQSAILNSHNANPIVTQPSLATIKSAIGSAFAGDTFTLPNGGMGTGGGLPAGVLSCSYDSPGFTYDGQPAIAQVTIACPGTSCGTL